MGGENMKIGAFAKLHHVTIDTIRHYMSLGLLNPDKQNNQYFFDEVSTKKMEEILRLKEAGFVLSEIKTIFWFKYLGNFTPYQVDEFYRTLFVERSKKIRTDIELFTQMRSNIDKQINELDQQIAQFERQRDIEQFKMGVDIAWISKLRCPACHGVLSIIEGAIKGNQLMDGVLGCVCQYTLHVEDGILIDHRDDLLPYHHFDSDFIGRYISETSPDYLDNIQKGIEWAKSKIALNSLQSKVVLELGSGLGFFMRNIYTSLPDDCLYIAVDYDMGRHRFLKRLLERADNKKQVLFICADFTNMPILHESIDVIVDFSGTSNYSFEHETFLLTLIQPFLKKDTLLLGSYILFKRFSSKGQITESLRKNFRFESVRAEISKQFEIVDEIQGQALIKGGIFEDYFVEGEIVFPYDVYGKRLG